MEATNDRLSLTLGIAVDNTTGCALQPDPTQNNFDVKIVNDSPRAVVLRYCGTGHNLCDGVFYDSGTLKPGQAWSDVATSVGESDPWLVQSLSGERLGCLPVAFDYNASGAVVRVSDIVPCRSKYIAKSTPTG
jgi:hypothetical protein